MSEDETKTIEMIKRWLDEYPKRKGVVVFWDDEKLEVHDIANVSGMHAAEFATRYRDLVLKTVGMDDFLTEEIT